MNLTQIIERIKEAYKTAYTAIVAENSRHENALNEYREHAKRYTVRALAEEHHAIREEHGKNIRNIVATLNAAKETLKNEFEEAIKLLYIPTGEAIDENDTLLLNSGIILTPSEVEDMTRKHAGNMTMLRIIETYVEDYKIAATAESMANFHRAKAAGTMEIDALKKFECSADMGIDLAMYSVTTADVLEKTTAKLEEHYNTFKAKMNLNKEGENNV